MNISLGTERDSKHSQNKSSTTLPTAEVFDLRPKNVKKFVEDTSKMLDPNEYSRDGSDAGTIIIFNQENFDSIDLGTRYGTRADVNELLVCFGRMGFNIEPKNIHNDLTRTDMMLLFDAIGVTDFKDTNCVIVIFLTHGNEDNTLYVRDGFVTTKEVMDMVVRNKSLDGKPKIFIFQACKGVKAVTSESEDNDVTIVPISTYHLSTTPDLLVVYSSLEGNPSFRHSLEGSWFIQELCRNISAYGRRDDLVSIMLRVNKCIATNYYDDYRNEKNDLIIEKQMPLFVSTLRKKFFLCRSKDRHYLLKSLEAQKKLNFAVKEMKEKIDKLIGDFEENFVGVFDV